MIPHLNPEPSQLGCVRTINSSTWNWNSWAQNCFYLKSSYLNFPFLTHFLFAEFCLALVTLVFIHYSIRWVGSGLTCDLPWHYQPGADSSCPTPRLPQTPSWFSPSHNHLPPAPWNVHWCSNTATTCLSGTSPGTPGPGPAARAWSGSKIRQKLKAYVLLALSVKTGIWWVVPIVTELWVYPGLLQVMPVICRSRDSASIIHRVLDHLHQAFLGVQCQGGRAQILGATLLHASTLTTASVLISRQTCGKCFD